MATTVTKTVNPAGGADYTSLASWESAQQGDITAAGRDEVILFPDFLEDSSEPERPVFVARENEIEWLTERLTLAVQSQGHVVFVSGDAGSGKTALMQAFGDRGLSDQPDLLVAW